MGTVNVVHKAIEPIEATTICSSAIFDMSTNEDFTQWVNSISSGILQRYSANVMIASLRSGDEEPALHFERVEYGCTDETLWIDVDPMFYPNFGSQWRQLQSKLGIYEPYATWRSHRLELPGFYEHIGEYNVGSVTLHLDFIAEYPEAHLTLMSISVPA